MLVNLRILLPSHEIHIFRNNPYIERFISQKMDVSRVFQQTKRRHLLMKYILIKRAISVVSEELKIARELEETKDI